MACVSALFVLFACWTTQDTPEARALLQQVHAGRQILGEPLSALETVLEGARAEWNKAKAASWAREPDGIGEAAAELAWMSEFSRDPIPGRRDRLELDRADVARFLLLARSELPSEASVLRARCQDVEILVERVRVKGSFGSESAQRYEDWRRNLPEVMIEVPRPGAEEWSGELKARVPAGSRVEVWLLGSHVELTVSDGEVKQGRYEELLFPQRGMWQAIALVGRDEHGKAVSASPLVWAKASNEDRTLEDVQRLVAESRREEETVAPIDPTDSTPVVIDGEIPRAVIDGCDRLEGSMPEVHVGEGYAWGPSGHEKLYPWRIRHRMSGIVLVLVRPGTFLMGEPEEQEGRQANSIQHEVEITRPFYLGEVEVTQSQWQRVIGNNPSQFKGRNRPVERISWLDAQTFLGALNRNEAGSPWRLPTEAEWEYACRAGTETAFSFGEEMSRHLANAGPLGRDAQPGQPKGFENGYETMPVGSFPPNPWGFYDMHGNVMEFCSDWNEINYYQTSPRQDPQGPARNEIRHSIPPRRVQRGGAFERFYFMCRSGYRLSTNPEERDYSNGLRIARTASP